MIKQMFEKIKADFDFEELAACAAMVAGTWTIIYLLSGWWEAIGLITFVIVVAAWCAYEEEEPEVESGSDDDYPKPWRHKVPEKDYGIDD